MQPDYTCMIVDDEQDSIDYLASLIGEHCPSLKIAATANRSSDAVKKYFKTQPDLVFMDIAVDELSGFDIISEIYSEKRKPHIIFVTCYDHYAIEAFKANALGYLLKPVSFIELIDAVKRFEGTKELELQQEKVLQLIMGHLGKVRFNTTLGFILLHPSEILYCEADLNYTKIFLSPEKFNLVSIHLALVEDKLKISGFQRISRSILINSQYLSAVNRRNKTCTLHWQNRDIVLPASTDMIKKL
jgi:two-component system, LytTR family, response regulator